MLNFFIFFHNAILLIPSCLAVSALFPLLLFNSSNNFSLVIVFLAFMPLFSGISFSTFALISFFSITISFPLHTLSLNADCLNSWEDQKCQLTLCCIQQMHVRSHSGVHGHSPASSSRALISKHHLKIFYSFSQFKVKLINKIFTKQRNIFISFPQGSRLNLKYI